MIRPNNYVKNKENPLRLLVRLFHQRRSIQEDSPEVPHYSPFLLIGSQSFLWTKVTDPDGDGSVHCKLSNEIENLRQMNRDFTPMIIDGRFQR